MRCRLTALCVAVMAIAMVACGKKTVRAPVVAGGDATRGRAAVTHYGCGACHTIGDIPSARGLVGPPLDGIAERIYIAGVVTNDPENLVRWIENPPAIDPKTAMPVLGVTDRDARDIAEYLYSLRASR